MTFTDGISLMIGGTMLFVIGMLVMRPEPGALKDWRFWLGSAVGAVGIGVALFGAFGMLPIR